MCIRDRHIIESNNLFGLADNYNMEIVECVYNKIIPLTNGKYIVIKDKMGGILDSDGSILFYPQAKRIHYFKHIDIFHYKIDDKWGDLSFLNKDIFYLSVDKLKYDEKLQIINVWKDGKLMVYNHNFSQIQTGYEQIEPTQFRQDNSRFYLGKRNGMWGMFRIKGFKSMSQKLSPHLNLFIVIMKKSYLPLEFLVHNMEAL